MKSQRYPLIDVARVFCAVLVVFIHAFEIRDGQPFYNMIITCFTQQAVPFFFIVSGYFFGKKIYNQENKTSLTIQYAKDMFLVYAAWMVLLLPVIVTSYISIYEGRSFFYIAAVIFRRIAVAGYSAYWYLLALGESVLVAGLCIRFRKEKILYALAMLGLILGLFYDAKISEGIIGLVNSLFYAVFSWSNNIVMKGLPYVSIGIFLSQRKGQLHRGIPGILYVMVSVASIIMFYVTEQPNFILLYPIQAVTLFLFAVQPIKAKISDRVCSICREMSSTIYFVHSIYIYYVIDNLWGVASPVLLKLSTALFMSIATYIIIEKVNVKPLNWLMSIKGR